MTKLAIGSGGTGVAISNAYKGWRPTQAWLAEAVRATATRMFAQAGLEGDESGNKGTIAVHRGGLTAQVYKVFGALFDENAAGFSVSWIIDLLVYLEDLADVGWRGCWQRCSCAPKGLVGNATCGLARDALWLGSSWNGQGALENRRLWAEKAPIYWWPSDYPTQGNGVVINKSRLVDVFHVFHKCLQCSTNRL